MRKVRKSQGFTQEEYAMQLGMSHLLTRDIEKGFRELLSREALIDPLR